MVVWKERQHEEDDAQDDADAASIAALWAYGLLKLFQAPSMISHVKLLEHIFADVEPRTTTF